MIIYQNIIIVIQVHISHSTFIIVAHRPLLGDSW